MKFVTQNEYHFWRGMNESFLKIENDSSIVQYQKYLDNYKIRSQRLLNMLDSYWYKKIDKYALTRMVVKGLCKIGIMNSVTKKCEQFHRVAERHAANVNAKKTVLATMKRIDSLVSERITNPDYTFLSEYNVQHSIETHPLI